MNDLEQMAIERLKAASDMSLAAYQQPLVICISGGKDSGVITELRYALVSRVSSCTATPQQMPRRRCGSSEASSGGWRKRATNAP